MMARSRMIRDSFLLFLFSGGICLFLLYPTFISRTWSPFWWILKLLGGISVLVSVSIGIVLLFIASQRTSKHYSTFEAIRHLICKYHRRYIGTRLLRRFRHCCKNSREAQETLLREIIKNNKDTVYGRQFQLGNISSLDDFRERHPVTEYKHFESFVERVARGEKNIMTIEKVSRLVLSSGTTGDSKMIPHDEYLADRTFTLSEAHLHEVFPSLQPMQTKLRYHCNAKFKKSEGGITMAFATALEQHMTRDMVMYCTPRVAFMIGTEYESTYIHLLFALRDKNLGVIWVTFVSIFVSIMTFLEDNWKIIVDDLAKGSLNPRLKLTEHMSRRLNMALGSGDAQRATEVRREFEKGFDGILQRLWPNLKIVSTIDNVGIRQTLKNSIAKGIEISSPFYISSEALLGLNLNPFNEGEEEYALYLPESIFEFIHVDDMDKPNPKTYLVDEIEVGQNYEIVLTQKYGLYRYRLGDVVHISGFYQSCPKVKFLYRKATLLNLVGEKVDETVIFNSIKTALIPWQDNVELSHYSVSESSLLTGLHNDNREEDHLTNLFYVIFLELNPKDGENLPNDLKTNLLAKEIDRNIYEHHKFFRVFKDTNQISRSIVYVVKRGTFLKLREYILANSSASRAQFKMPRKLRTREMGQVLLNGVEF